MKILALIVAMTLAVPAHNALAQQSQPAPPNLTLSKKDQQQGAKYLPLVKSFGLTQYKSAKQASPVSKSFKYYEDGQQGYKWNKMASVDLFQADANAGTAFETIVEAYQTQAEGKQNIDAKTYGKGDEAAAYVEYAIGVQDFIAVHTLTMVWHPNDGEIGVFQLNKKNGKHSKEDIEKFKRLVKKTAK